VALGLAVSKATREREQTTGEHTFEELVTVMEREGRADEEKFEVVDDTTAERGIELLQRGLVIQDEAANGSLEGLDVQHHVEEIGNEVLDCITVRPINPDAEVMEHLGHQTRFSTPKQRFRKSKEPPAMQLAKIEESREGQEDDEMVSDNETMRKQTGRKGKGKLTDGAATLDQLNADMDIFEQGSERRKFEEVRGNLFATHPPSWKLEDNQKGWSQEATQESVRTAAEVVIPDSDDDMDSDEGSIPDGTLSRDRLIRRYKQIPLVGNFSPAKNNGPMATVEVAPAVPVIVLKEIMDSEYGGLNFSKHAVKTLTLDEVKKMAKKMRTGCAGDEEEEEVQENEKMGMGEEREITWGCPSDIRTKKELILSIIFNGKVMEDIKKLDVKKKWWKSAHDFKVAKQQVVLAGWLLEAGCFHNGDREGGGWKKLKEKVKAGTTKIDPVDVMEASMLFMEACKTNTGDLGRIESQLEKLIK